MEKSTIVNENIKKTSFLFLLFGFVLLSIFVVTSLTDKGLDIGSSFANSENSEANYVSQTSSINPQPYNPEITSSSSFTPIAADNAGEVESASANGCDTKNRPGCISDSIAYQPVCTQVEHKVDVTDGSVTGDDGGSVLITQNSIVEIWKVTAPVAILSGKENIVDDTNTIKNGVYRSADNLIDKRIASTLVVPGQEVEELDQTIENAPKGDFSVNVSASLGGGATSASDQATISKEHESMCTDLQPSNPNPGITNDLSEELIPFYATPGDPIEPRNYIDASNPTCTIIDPLDIDLPNSDVYETCTNRRSAFDGIIGAKISIENWFNCQDPEAPGCEETVLVGLMVDAMFGSNQLCNDGFCADQYFDYAASTNISPVDIVAATEPGLESKGEPLLKSHYVTTPCSVRIDFGEVFDIPCLWDISPYKAIYDLEVAKLKPGDPDVPTWEEYWADVEKDAESRGAICSY